MKAALSWLLVQLCMAAALLSGTAALLWGAWHLLVGIAVSHADETAVYWRSALPDEIGVTELVARGTDVGFLDRAVMLFVPAPWKVCGGVVFGLSDATRAGLEREGLAALEHARVGRGHRGPPQEHRYTYDPWQETPVPPAWTSEGMWRGLDCLSKHWAVADQVLTEARRPDAYFTELSHAQLLVVPGLKLVVLTYDR